MRSIIIFCILFHSAFVQADGNSDTNQSLSNNKTTDSSPQTQTPSIKDIVFLILFLSYQSFKIRQLKPICAIHKTWLILKSI